MHQNPYAAPTPGYETPGRSAGPSGHHEFDAQQNQVIAKLAKRARIWGVLSLVAGIFGCLGTLVLVLSGLFALASMAGDEAAVVGLMILALAVVLGARMGSFVVIGLRYIKSAKSLSLVVDTQGQDVALAVDATENMGKAFWLDFWVQIVIFGVTFLGMMIMFIVAIAMS